MRIIGEIPHPFMKITAFKNDGKLSLKFEAGMLEQIYKFRDDERLQTFEDIQKIVSQDFIEKIEEILRGMSDAKLAAMKNNLPQNEGEEFMEIL